MFKSKKRETPAIFSILLFFMLLVSFFNISEATYFVPSLAYQIQSLVLKVFDLTIIVCFILLLVGILVKYLFRPNKQNLNKGRRKIQIRAILIVIIIVVSLKAIFYYSFCPVSRILFGIDSDFFKPKIYSCFFSLGCPETSYSCAPDLFFKKWFFY